MDACFCFKKHTFHFCHIGYIPIVERFLSRCASSLFNPISAKRIAPRWFDANPAISFSYIYISTTDRSAFNVRQLPREGRQGRVRGGLRRPPCCTARKSNPSRVDAQNAARPQATSTAPSRSPGASRRSATTSAAATTATTTAATAATTAAAMMIVTARFAASLAFSPSHFRRRRRALPPARPLRRPPRPGRLRPPRPRARRLRPPRRPPLDSADTIPLSPSRVPSPLVNIEVHI